MVSLDSRDPMFSRRNVLLANTIALFLISSIIYFLYLIANPVGDEPDFSVRSLELFRYINLTFTPYKYLGFIINEIKLDNVCEIIANPFSIWAKIAVCSISLKDVLLRLLLTMICVFSLITISIIRLSINNKNVISRCLILSLFTPGIIYYLSVFSFEQYTLFLSLLAVLFIENVYVILIALILLALADFGNSLIPISFFLIYWPISKLVDILGGKVIFLLLFLVSLLLLYTRDYVVAFGASLATSTYVQNVFATLIQSPEVHKYPIIFRPFVTFITMIDARPSGLKAPLVFILSVLPLAWSYIKYIKRVNNDNNEISLILSAFFIIIYFTILLPTYSFAKYYIFLIPFFLIPPLRFFGFKNCFIYIVILNCLFIFLLGLYRL